MDHTVPRGISKYWDYLDSRERRAYNEATDRQLAERILAELQRLGQDGWQAEHLTDFNSLRREDRVERRIERVGSVLGFGGAQMEIFDSVTLRLKRLVPD